MKDIKFKLHSHLLPILFVIAAALYPVIFMYGQNAAEVDFIEVFSVAITFTLIAIVIYLLSCILLKSPAKSSIFAAVLMIYGTNYMLFQNMVTNVFSNLKYWHILPIGLFILGHVLYFLFKYASNDFLKNIASIGALIMTVLMVVNLIQAIPAIAQKIENELLEIKSNYSADPKDNQPNIYWMVFDECASFPVIEKYYEYTDPTVYNHLLSKGFYISNTSHNDCCDTHLVLTNCINLDYVVTSTLDMAHIEQYRIAPPMYRFLSEQGYTLRGVGDTEWLGGIPSMTMQNSIGGQTVEGYSAEYLILKNTVFGPFIEFDDVSYTETILSTLDYYKNPENINPDSSEFNFLYIQSPHVPFIFDKDGNFVSYLNFYNWSDKQYYLGQYEYIMNHMVEIVDTILENDPNCILILQSDHGPRHTEGITFEEKTNILNAVYFKNEDISEIEGASGINTFRKIFNRLFDAGFEEVELPNES